MGVPALFRWLSQKYAKIVSPVVEEPSRTLDEGQVLPPDTSQPNPNGMEFDNLYLDMNGIIHPCCHPEDRPAPKTEEEMFLAIFAYIDRIFAMIRPRKLLFMAIDGVAPRAKMNQQRSRRFRASKEAKEKEVARLKAREEMIEQGVAVEEESAVSNAFDSNCITPGTPFMAHLADALRYYIADRLSNDPGWQRVQVLFSDASVPGEGEHKIMDYIRRQRLSPDHDTNLKHVLYGLDADLIMLALATHEPHFKILREDVFFDEKNKSSNTCFKCQQPGHRAAECTNAAVTTTEEPTEPIIQVNEEGNVTPVQKPFIFLHVHVLREYLESEMFVQTSNVPFDLERVLDDWVFLCFFVGNDFLPHLPSLEIREGAIDTLIGIYKRRFSGYLTEHGSVHLERVQPIIEELGQLEDLVFQRRREKDQRREREEEARKMKLNETSHRSVAPLEIFSVKASNETLKKASEQAVKNVAVAAQLRSQLKRKLDEKQVEKVEEKTDEKPIEKPIEGKEENSEIIPKEESDSEDEIDLNTDTVRLWESGWKQRYYRQKFQVELSDKKFISSVVKAYVEGLCWVMSYYYQGCVSWEWYYPFHYAPFASDFVELSEMNLEFTLGKPFQPLEQLMAVLPAASRQHIPDVFHALMTEPDSEIIDFYPEDFPIDLNGKKHAWQGVALLPFIEQDRLLRAMHQLYDRLSEEEKERNARGEDVLFVGSDHFLFDKLCLLYTKRQEKQPLVLHFGSVLPDPKVCLPGSLFPSCFYPLPDLENQSISSLFFHPLLAQGEKFLSHLKTGAQLAPRSLQSSDLQLARSGGRGGRGGGGRSQYHSMHREWRDKQEQQREKKFKKNHRGYSGQATVGNNYGNHGHYQQSPPVQSHPYGPPQQQPYPFAQPGYPPHQQPYSQPPPGHSFYPPQQQQQYGFPTAPNPFHYRPPPYQQQPLQQSHPYPNHHPYAPPSYPPGHYPPPNYSPPSQYPPQHYMPPPPSQPQQQQRPPPNIAWQRNLANQKRK